MRPDVTLDDLADLRWKCRSCDEWHTGPCLDFSYDAPYYWRKEYDEVSRKNRLQPGWSETDGGTFLTEDYCAIGDEDFFVRGVIHLPIVGAAETLRWGIWGSLSRQNFEKLLEMNEDTERIDLPEMFSWMSTRIPEYPDTLNLKMYARVQELGQRPYFRLERSDHPLAQEYYKGVSPERVKEIMLGQLAPNE